MFTQHALIFRENPLVEFRRLLLSYAVLIAVTVFTSACTWDSNVDLAGHQAADEAKFGNQWDTPFDRMGVVPVLPPSEDVRVGDIFVYSFNPDLQIRSSNRSRRTEISISPRWDSLSLLQDLEAEYRMRPDWPATPDLNPQSANGASRSESGDASTAQARNLFSAEHVPQRLRIFGVPELNTFVLSEEQANSVVPSEAINLVFGSAWNDDKVIAIRINSAETYSLGLRKVIGAALDDTGPEIVIREPYRNQLYLLADPAVDSVWVRILSDVVYVRSIDIIIQSRSGFEEDEEANASEFVAGVEETVTVTEEEIAAGETVAQTATQGMQDGEDSGNNGPAADNAADEEILRTETVTEVVPDHALDPAYAAFVRANAINEMLVESSADELTGGFLRFVSVTDDSITVRRVWHRGLAVGARGLSLEVDKVTGTVLRSGNMGTLIP